MKHKQLWLTVYEDVSSNWPPTIETHSWNVSVTMSETLQGCRQQMPFRSSPIFSTLDHIQYPNVTEGTFYIDFLCYEAAFPIIATLIDYVKKEQNADLYFNLGLASIVFISRQSNLIEKIGQAVKERPFATETWQIENSRIVKVIPKINSPKTISVPAHIVPVYDSLPLTQRTTIDEFVSSIGLVAVKILAHLPEEEVTVKHIIVQANELIGEMLYACNPQGDPPASLSEYKAIDFENNPSLIETILHQATDRLIQINTAISYLTTQALSGAVPILERRSLIRRYSLLGVGSAIMALTRIARSIEQAFSEGAIETILGERGTEASAIPGLGNPPEYDPRGWNSHSVNRWENKVEPRAPHPKLPYFSNTLGFRESEYTISAAAQALGAGSDPEWSLLTLTHEMVHGHVRNILSAILQGSPAEIPQTTWESFYTKFDDFIEKRISESDICFLDSLRFILLLYCCMTYTHGSLTNRRAPPSESGNSKQIRFDFEAPASSEALRQLLENEFRNINEILVHTLDFHYFYCSSLSAYLPLIWSSWSIMPQVKGDLRQYLLRSILVSASKTSGTPWERFCASHARVQELLQNLLTQSTRKPSAISDAVAFLSNEESLLDLFGPFSASLILVDLADKILTSTSIRGRLNGNDENLNFVHNEESAEEWFEYSLPGGFVEHAIKAPTAYIADRLAKNLMHRDDSKTEHETVVLFLACCSHSKPGDKT